MVNYQEGKIYRIVNDVNDYQYIGSTAQKYLSSRMTTHCFASKTNGSPFYTAMRDIGVKCFKILLVKSFPCNSKLELEAEEFKIMDKLKNKGVHLYNSTINRQPSNSTKQKIGDANRNRGCINYNLSKRSWLFIWYVDGKKRARQFSTKRWGGEWSARKMCEYLQKLTYPQ